MTTEHLSTDLSTGLSQDEMLTRIRRLQIRARRLVRLLFLGEYHSVFRGRGLEFSEVREYQPGDEVRTIDWNVTARMGTPYVKKFVEERELILYLLVDISASSGFSSSASTKRELSAELATLLAFAADANNDKTGLIAFSDRVELYIPPKKGQQHVLRLARELLYLEPKGRGTAINAAADLLMRVAKRPGVAFLISDFHARGFEPSLRLAAQKHDVTAISLTDPRELELPRVGLIGLRDPETGAEMLVDTEDRRERDRYAAAAADAVVSRRRLLASLGIEEIPLRTDRSYIQPLMAYFQARAGRAAVKRMSRLQACLTASAVATLLFLAGGTAGVLAADPVVIEMEVGVPDRLTVGDRVRFVVKMEADQGTTITVAPGGIPSVLSQTGRVETTARNLSGGRVELTVTIEAAPFATGDIQLAPLILRFRTPDGANGTVQTPPSRLQVDSVLPQSGTLTPRDLKPQAEIGTATSPLLLRALAVTVVALAVVLGLLVWRLRRSQPVPPVMPAGEPGAPGLEDMERRVLDTAPGFLAAGDYVTYYTTLSSAVRNYLSERYDFPAFALTTTEMQERMVRQGVDRWQARLVGGLLNQCDAVVYASYRPAYDRADTDLTAAYEIIEMSRPDRRESEAVGTPS